MLLKRCVMSLGMKESVTPCTGVTPHTGVVRGSVLIKEWRGSLGVCDEAT